MAKIHGFNKLTLLDYPGRLAEREKESWTVSV